MTRAAKVNTAAIFAMLGFLSIPGIALAQASEPELPPLAKPGQGAVLSANLIYSLENRPTPQCHASTIAETPTGLVAAWFAGTREKHSDVGVRISRLANGKWTPVLGGRSTSSPSGRCT